MTSYELSDRFTTERGTVFLSGTQALTRIPVEQILIDRRAGHDTAALVTGYPGSPLGGFDTAMARTARLSPDLPIVCRPAVNEEYAATAVMGSQLAAAQPDHHYDGVIGLWYGKAPGVDRATDALRHAVYAGTSALGGAVAIVGDDPMAKSSTVPSSSAGVLSDLHMPLLYPGDPAAALDLGRHAIALSRHSGLWSALKIVSDVADGTATVAVDIDRVQPVLPEVDGLEYTRMPEGRLLTPLTVDLEQEIYEVRYELARAYASANRLNRVTADPADAWLGVVASGITYREVLEAFHRLGLVDEDAIAACGVRLIEMQMPIPFDARTVRHFARGLDEIFVIEEKQPNMELLIKDALYSARERPAVLGKQDEDGLALIPGFGGLDADSIVSGLRARLEPRVADRLAPPPPAERELIPVAAGSAARSPFYCSGCPHNRSTEVPDGTLVGAGIGCHTMALLMDPDRVGDIAGITPMGNEGTQWVGMADFVEREHFIQNLGDGTYFHSGQLAITAAIAAEVNITYKLLYNEAIAMTGGQQPQGLLSVPEIAALLCTQGASQVLITTDDTAKYRSRQLPAGVEVWSRDRLIEAQEHLATVPGTTVLIHDQACAAQLRRQRRRGRAETPTERVVINHRVCEGCGDCGEVSNCLSVQPVDTEYGRKTRIDQTSCNFDYSCLEGDCPSFMTVRTGPRRLRRLFGRLGRDQGDPPATTPNARLDALLAEPLPDPVLVVPADDVAIRIAGIGGTGVVTVAQVVATGAMLDGFTVRGLDQIGLSQKAGPVVSDLRLARDDERATNRLGAQQADVILAFDQLVAASEKGVLPASATRTVVVGSTSPTPTGAMITHPEVTLPGADTLDDRLAVVTRPGQRHWADAVDLATRAFGDAQTANMLVTGMAVQAGALPVDPGRIEEAIALNGVTVDTNIASFRLGRHVLADAAQVEEVLGAQSAITAEDSPDPVIALRAQDSVLADRVEALDLSDGATATVARNTADLIGYQDRVLAEHFLATVEETAGAERRVAPGSERLVTAVAYGLHKLTAYKDEYEVARLILEPEGRAAAEALAATGGSVRYRLHPPILRALGWRRKIALGRWSHPMFRLLRASRRLRGTVADPFRWAQVRREERRLPEEYRVALTVAFNRLGADQMDTAIAIAELPDVVRGYEDLKLRRMAEFRERLAHLVARLD